MNAREVNRLAEELARARPRPTDRTPPLHPRDLKHEIDGWDRAVVAVAHVLVEELGLAEFGRTRFFARCIR